MLCIIGQPGTPFMLKNLRDLPIHRSFPIWTMSRVEVGLR